MADPIDPARYNTYQTIGGARHGYNPDQTYQTVNGQRHAYDPTQNYINLNGLRIPIGTPASRVDAAVAAAPTPPQFQYTFDTIGQTIYRSIGHCRLPLRTIWALGINESGDSAISNTQTFAAALCAPIDPLEDGEIFAIWAGGNQVYDSTGPITPTGWTPEDAELLATSLAGIVIFPGNEAQLPAQVIVDDKGADKTNAFRGIRYLIIPDYPINGGNGNGLPQLSVGWLRKNDAPDDSEAEAVEFLAGSA